MKTKPVRLDRLVVMNAGSGLDTKEDMSHLLSLFAEIRHLQMSSVSQGSVQEGHRWMTRIGVFGGPWPHDARHQSAREEETDGVDGKGGLHGRVAEDVLHAVAERVVAARPKPRSPTAAPPLNTIPLSPKSPIQGPRVTTARLEDVANKAFLEILGSGSVKTLRVLDVQLSTIEDGVALRSLLAKCGARLEHLAVDFSPYLEASQPKGSDPMQRISGTLLFNPQRADISTHLTWDV